MSIGATGRGYANRARNFGTVKLLSGVSLAALALAALSAGPAAAQNWTGATSDDWTVGANWVGGTVPVGGTVVINTISPNPTILGKSGPAVGTTGQLIVGNLAGSSGDLTIRNGSALTSSSIAANQFHIGSGANTAGIVTVTGAGSRWTTSGSQIIVGAAGNGALNIQNGAAVVAQSGVTLGSALGGTGALNINGGSTLETNSLGRSANGSGQVNFDNATLRARISNAIGFVAGFSPGELNIAAGGLTVDTQTFTVGASSSFGGVGGLTKSGTGTLNLRAVNTYSGETVIHAGTLGLTSNGSIAASSRVVANGTFNISTMTAAATSIQSLAGSGSVRLGAKNLTITDAKNDVFSGVIGDDGGAGDTGGLTLTGGTQTLSGVNKYTGATNVNGGTLVVNGSITSDAAISALGTLGGTGTIFGDVTNDGVVAPGAGGIGELTIDGNYTGNGGTVRIETALGGDTSDTDRLVVNGDSSGNSSLIVTNVGGAGAQTGTAGIKVVDVGGTSTGTFALIGDYVFEGDQAVVGGAYAYRLYQGTENLADGDWYLRSEIIDAGPLYAPTVPLYENYANVLQGFNELGTLQQRVGGREWLNGGQRASRDDGAIAPDAIWARMDASQGHFEPGVSTTGASYDVSTWRLQAGMDGVLHQGEAGSLVAGVNAQFGTVSSDIASMYGAGSIDAMGFGVGGTLTWYGAGGLYVDGQAQATWYSADITSDDTGTMLVEGNDAFGYGLSIEAGQKIGLDDNWSLTPQAQLSYSAVSFSDFTDQYDGTVSLSDGGDTLVGRLGLSADYEGEWQDANGETKLTHLYGVANLYYDFLDGSSVDVSGTEFTSQNQGLWGGVGIGGSLSWANEQYSVFGEALVRGSVDDFGDNNAVGAKVGFNAKW